MNKFLFLLESNLRTSINASKCRLYINKNFSSVKHVCSVSSVSKDIIILGSLHTSKNQDLFAVRSILPAAFAKCSKLSQGVCSSPLIVL